jgi:hypothetical protein
VTLTGFVLLRSRTALISRLRVDREPVVTVTKKVRRVPRQRVPVPQLYRDGRLLLDIGKGR